MARYISCVSVFFFSGRRIVIVRVDSSSATMMCSVMAGPLKAARDYGVSEKRAAELAAERQFLSSENHTLVRFLPDARRFGRARNSPGVIFLAGHRYSVQCGLVGFFIYLRMRFHGRARSAMLLVE